MATQFRLTAAAVLLICSLVVAVSAGGRDLQQATACNQQRVDKHFVFVVDNRVCNFYRPGNQTERGTAVFRSAIVAPTDCILVNNSFPGPPIRVNLGDWVRVDVQNNLFGRHISLHWHGLRMDGTPWADGASYINSCPIPAGQGTTYIWHADEAGLYFYHGHGGLEEEYGLSGALIIDDPNDPYRALNLYDQEAPELVELRDMWWASDSHASQALAFRYYQQLAPYGIPLMNGFYGNGSDVLPYPELHMSANTCYRTKFICANTEWPGWFVSITDQNNAPVNMTMLTLTGENIRPVNTHRFAFYIAQRAEAVICTGAPGTWRMLVNSSQPEEGYCSGPTPGCINDMTILIRIDAENTTVPKTANRSLLNSYPFYETWDSLINPEWVVPYTPLVVPQNPTQTWEIFTAIIPGNMYAWTERNWGMVMPTAPPLFTRGGRCGQAPEPLPGQRPNATNNRAYLQKTVRHGEVVDIIFQNLSPFYHPMHLHGYDMTVLASRYYVDAGYAPQPQNVCPNDYLWANPAWDGTPGPPWPRTAPGGGNFGPFAFGCPRNASQDNSRFNLPNPYKTDIVPVPAHGWTHVRVRFDNPGTWYFHCHLAIHMFNGMGFIVNAGMDRVPRTPSWVDTSCTGACPVQGQICGDYSRTRARTPLCSSARDTCAPQGIYNNMYMG